MTQWIHLPQSATALSGYSHSGPPNRECIRSFMGPGRTRLAIAALHLSLPLLGCHPVSTPPLRQGQEGTGAAKAMPAAQLVETDLESPSCRIRFSAPPGSVTQLRQRRGGHDVHWDYAFDWKGEKAHFWLSCHPVVAGEDQETEPLESIGVQRDDGKGWTAGGSGRYSAELQWVKPFQTQTWSGIVAYISGWFGDGASNGQPQFGFCVAPSFRVCGGMVTESGELDLSLAEEVFARLVVIRGHQDSPDK